MSTPKRKTDGAGLTALPKPTEQEIAAQLADLGLEVETLKSQLKAARNDAASYAEKTKVLMRESASLLAETKQQGESIAALSSELSETKAARDSAFSQVDLLQAECRGLHGDLERERAKHVAEMQEAARDKQMVQAELVNVARQRDAAIEDRATFEAALEEWTSHPFFGAIDQLNRQCGEVSAELVEHTDRVVSAANDTGKPGKVTLTLAIKPSDEHARALIAAAKITSTLPKADPAKAVFFMKDGRVTADDPAQPTLPMTVPTTRRPAPTADERDLERKLAQAKPVAVVPAQCPDVPEGMTDDYDRVLELAHEDSKLSVTTIQRRLGIGYVRAAALHDLLLKRNHWAAANP